MLSSFCLSVYRVSFMPIESICFQKIFSPFLWLTHWRCRLLSGPSLLSALGLEGGEWSLLPRGWGGRCTKTLVRHMRIGTKSPIMPSHIHSQGPGSDALIQPSLLPWLQHANSNCASSLEKSYPKGRTRSRHWAAPDNDTHAVQYPSPTRLLSALSDLLHIFGRTLTVTGESNCRVFCFFLAKAVQDFNTVRQRK